MAIHDEDMTLEDAEDLCVGSRDLPGRERGRKWAVAAKLLYAEVLRLRGPAALSKEAPPPTPTTYQEACEALYNGGEGERVEFQRCPVSNKRCYGSERLAIVATRSAGHPFRPYFCKGCKQWHVAKRTE